ncbi:MAG: hypothetical protein GX934_07030 [Burkholderiales bacterium]|nr:hypothetical protein [Burkholderiales bacterium]
MKRPAGPALLFLMLLAVFAFLFLAFLRSPRPPESPTPPPVPVPRNQIRIGVSDRPATLPVWALGRLLQGRGLRLEVLRFEDPGRMWEMLAAGELDLVLSTLDEFALAVPRHDPGVLLFPSALSLGSDAVLARSGLVGPMDLQGRAVAYVEGSAGGYLTLTLMAIHPGLHFRTVPARNPAQAVEWLRHGDVEAAALWEPWTSALQAEGFKALWTSKDQGIMEVWVASRQVLKGRGVGVEVLEILAGSWLGLIDRLRTNPGLATNAIAEEARQKPAAIHAILQTGLKFLSLDEARRVSPETLVQTMQAMSNDWSLHGAFLPPAAPRNVDPSTTVDTTLLETLALPEKGLLVEPSESLSPPSQDPMEFSPNLVPVPPTTLPSPGGPQASPAIPAEASPSPSSGGPSSQDGPSPTVSPTSENGPEPTESPPGPPDS